VSLVGLALFGLWVLLCWVVVGLFFWVAGFFVGTCCWVDSVGLVGVLWVCLWVG
jgi:hypothetical protein